MSHRPPCAPRPRRHVERQACGQDLRHGAGYVGQYARGRRANRGAAPVVSHHTISHALACPFSFCRLRAAALSEAEHAFTTFNTEKEVAQAVRNAFVKKVRHRRPRSRPVQRSRRS